MILTTSQIIQIIMGGIGSLGFSVLFHIKGYKLLLAGLGGIISWALFLILEPWFPDEAVRYLLSSMLIGFYAEILARVQKTPTTTYLVPSIIPHIPGGSLYNTMKAAVNRDWMLCLSKGFDTIMLALGLALGIILGSSVFKMWTASVQHFERKKQI